MGLRLQGMQGSGCSVKAYYVSRLGGFGELPNWKAQDLREGIGLFSNLRVCGCKAQLRKLFELQVSEASGKL